MSTRQQYIYVGVTKPQCDKRNTLYIYETSSFKQLHFQPIQKAFNVVNNVYIRNITLIAHGRSLKPKINGAATARKLPPRVLQTGVSAFPFLSFSFRLYVPFIYIYIRQQDQINRGYQVQDQDQEWIDVLGSGIDGCIYNLIQYNTITSIIIEPTRLISSQLNSSHLISSQLNSTPFSRVRVRYLGLPYLLRLVLHSLPPPSLSHEQIEWE